MAAWTHDELERLGDAEELTLASLREDGTLRPPVIMWVVRDGDDIYVRSLNGRGSSWFRGAQKYGRRYPTIVPSIVAPDARAATLQLVPHPEETT